MRDNVKEDLLLFGDSWFDGNKNKVIREATTIYTKNPGRFSGFLLECFVIEWFPHLNL